MTTKKPTGWKKESQRHTEAAYKGKRKQSGISKYVKFYKVTTIDPDGYNTLMGNFMNKKDIATEVRKWEKMAGRKLKKDDDYEVEEMSVKK
jgi:ribonuclease HIII